MVQLSLSFRFKVEIPWIHTAWISRSPPIWIRTRRRMYCTWLAPPLIAYLPLLSSKIVQDYALLHLESNIARTILYLPLSQITGNKTNVSRTYFLSTLFYLSKLQKATIIGSSKTGWTAFVGRAVSASLISIWIVHRTQGGYRFSRLQWCCYFASKLKKLPVRNKSKKKANVFISRPHSCTHRHLYSFVEKL